MYWWPIPILTCFQGLLYGGNDTLFESTGLRGQVSLNSCSLSLPPSLLKDNAFSDECILLNSVLLNLKVFSRIYRQLLDDNGPFACFTMFFFREINYFKVTWS